jgi:hypothetical protein
MSSRNTEIMIPASPAYRHVYSRLGTEHVMGGFVAEQAGRAVAIRLFRSRREGAFQAREIRRYERLVPHLASSLELVQTRSRTAQLTEIITRGMIPPGGSFCVVDARFTVALASPGGEALLAVDEGGGRRLAGAAMARNTTLRRQLADGRELVARRVDDMATEAGLGLAGPLCVLHAHGENQPAWLARRFAERFRLTPAEGRLLEALCTLQRPSLQAAAARRPQPLATAWPRVMGDQRRSDGARPSSRRRFARATASRVAGLN